MHNEQLEEFARGITATSEYAARALQPMIEQRERLVQQFQPLLDLHSRLVDQLQPFIDQQEQIARAFQPLLDVQLRINEQLEPFLSGIQAAQASIAPFLDDVGRVFQELPPRQRRAFEILAVNGWYLDPRLAFREIFDVADLFEDGDRDAGHARMCGHFDRRIDDLEAELCEASPTRARLLKAALGAHRRGEFALSIPVFLAQADGICSELIGVQLYAREDGKPKLARHLTLSTDRSFKGVALHPLMQPMPISATPKERATMTDILNRHTVLHGESVDYDTKINSCRALSLLVYVAWVLKRGEASAA